MCVTIPHSVDLWRNGQSARFLWLVRSAPGKLPEEVANVACHRGRVRPYGNVLVEGCAGTIGLRSHLPYGRGLRASRAHTVLAGRGRRRHSRLGPALQWILLRGGLAGLGILPPAHGHLPRGEGHPDRARARAVA